MTSETLHDAITLLPSDLITEADKKRTAPRTVIPWKRYVAMAACFALVMASSIWCLQYLGRGGAKETAAEAPAIMQETAAAAEAAPAAAAGIPEEFAADEAGAETAPKNSSADSSQSGNTACQGAATLEVTVSGDFAPRSLTPDERLALSRLLSSLTYRPEDVCECIAEITVTVNGEDKFFINLDEGFVRGPQGQAKLTQAQIDTLREIFYPAEED